MQYFIQDPSYEYEQDNLIQAFNTPEEVSDYLTKRIPEINEDSDRVFTHEDFLVIKGEKVFTVKKMVTREAVILKGVEDETSFI